MEQSRNTTNSPAVLFICFPPTEGPVPGRRRVRMRKCGEGCHGEEIDFLLDSRRENGRRERSQVLGDSNMQLNDGPHTPSRSESHFGLAFSLACPFCNSTVYSTALQPYSFLS